MSNNSYPLAYNGTLISSDASEEQEIPLVFLLAVIGGIICFFLLLCSLRLFRDQNDEKRHSGSTSRPSFTETAGQVESTTSKSRTKTSKPKQTEITPQAGGRPPTS